MTEFNIKSVPELLDARGLGLTMHNQVQKYVDSSVLRLSAKYIPKDTGTLIRSGTAHTVIGSGHVRYVTPYAKEVYYTNAGYGRNGTQNGGLRGKLWFERMKADCKDKILKGAQALADRGGDFQYTMLGEAADGISSAASSFKKSAKKSLIRSSRTASRSIKRTAKKAKKKTVKIARKTAKTIKKKFKVIKRKFSGR